MLYLNSAPCFQDGVRVLGRVREAGTFAEIHVADGSTAQSIAAGTGYTKLTAFAENGPSSNCTADYANDKITLLHIGKYMVNGDFSIASGTNNVTFKIAAFLGGVEQHNVHVQRKVSVAGDIGAAGFSGIVDVTSVPVDLDMRARHDNVGAVDLTVSYANINVEYIGE